MITSPLCGSDAFAEKSKRPTTTALRQKAGNSVRREKPPRRACTIRRWRPHGRLALRHMADLPRFLQHADPIDNATPTQRVPPVPGSPPIEILLILECDDQRV